MPIISICNALGSGCSGKESFKTRQKDQYVTTMTNNIINQRFRESVDYILLQKFAKSKKEIASIMGIKPSTLSEILKDRMSIGLYMIEPYCVNYNISVDWLITGRGEMMRNHTAQNEEHAEQKAQYMDLMEMHKQIIKEREDEVNRLISLVEQKSHCCRMPESEKCPLATK